MREVNRSASKRIVVGVDCSGPSKAALHWAARQAELTGSDLEVVMAWKRLGPELPTILPDVMPAKAAEKRLTQFVETELGPVAGLELELAAYVAEGPVAEVLLREAKGADMLVVGSRGHGRIVGMLLGSVSEHCVTHANCPVVVIR